MKENNHTQTWQSSPDLRIWKKITDRLNKHPKIDAGDIEVEVNKGEITLKGKADTEEEKRLAENIVMSVWVSRVENHLHTGIGLGMPQVFLCHRSPRAMVMRINKKPLLAFYFLLLTYIRFDNSNLIY